MKTAYLLHQLLSESAARRPEAVALGYEQQALTYGELEGRSNQLAHALIAGGVSPGDRVAIHLKKSIEAIVSIFAILKTGACYIPIEFSNPAPRLAEIIRQCSVRCLITSTAASGKLGTEFFEGSTLERVLFTDAVAGYLPDLPLKCHSFREVMEGQSTQAPACGGTDQDLAYILFTSGSTGRPKGVMLSHLNALTFVNWGHDTFGIEPQDRLSNHAPLNFDLSVFDIFVAMKAGASVNLVPEGLSMFPVRLAEFTERQQITVWYSVPSVLTLLLLHGGLQSRDLSRLRLILFAGEVFPIKYLRALMRALPQARYFNLYGPTETNVCTYYEAESVPEDRATSIPIGKACANTEVLAIDEQGRRVISRGHEGLLYVRGSTVMQGYFGQPAETDACFIKNPFSPGREERLYCTRDWVTLDEQGNYLFLGRKDHMVKTRGYRVELGEIESVLYAHPGVREAVALAIPDELLGNKIKVVLVLENSHSLDEKLVKRHCARSLPKYMVPEEVEFRESLPRTVTDKIDRTRLRNESMQARI